MYARQQTLFMRRRISVPPVKDINDDWSDFDLKKSKAGFNAVIKQIDDKILQYPRWQEVGLSSDLAGANKRGNK
jgi:hypothetical protein